MKTSLRFTPLAANAVLIVAAFALTMTAQDPQAPPPAAGGRPPRTYSAPTNLKVLPKTMTGRQVRETMEGWAGSLGVHCDTCHAVDPAKTGPNGRPRLKFDDDSKPEKSTARLMYTMTEDINSNYVSMVPAKPNSVTAKVTCGTCHRGHLEPETFVIPPEREWPQGPKSTGNAPTEAK